MAQSQTRAIVDIAKDSLTAYNDKNWEKVRALLTPDCVYEEVATNVKTHGPDETVSVMQGWARAMPDSKATFDGQIVKDNTVVLEITWRGTHSGPLPTPKGDIPPSGKRFEVRACQIVEVSGERVKTTRHYFDMNTLFQQLNVRP